MLLTFPRYPARSTALSAVQTGVARYDPPPDSDIAVLTLDIHMRLVSEQEDTYWREHFSQAPYYVAGRSYDQYRPAYELGWQTALQYPDAEFEDLADRLHRQWAVRSGSSLLPWREVHQAVHAAWLHASQQMRKVQQPAARVECSRETAASLLPLQRGCALLAEDLQRMCTIPMSDFAHQVIQRHILMLRDFAYTLHSHVKRAFHKEDMGLTTWPSRLRRRWMAWRDDLSDWAPAQVFEVCELRERTLLSSYQRVLRKTLPVEVRELLQMQSKRLRVHMEKLSWVRHNWNLE